MKRHSCLHNSKVVNSRSRTSGKLRNVIYRRRECLVCHDRFSTHEVEVETVMTEVEHNRHKRQLRHLQTKLSETIADLQKLVGEEL